ncbi:MAG: hypothetical protein H7321_07185, partial [Bacteroidia bacterium]|nr:hypothetical protein [Bacteroidia bacterium]
MNRIKLLIAFSFLLAANLVQAQTNVDDFVVNATATVQASPPKITLNWTASSAVSYTIFRKLKTEQQFGSAIGTVAGTGSTFIDNNVKVGIAYDYLIQKTTSSYYGFGELDAGIEIPLNDKRGNILLVIDSAIATSITSELKQYKEDLIGDGWKVSTVFVSSTMKVPAVKSKIAIWYNADKTNNKAAMLIGHIPVPYSGLMDASNNNDFPPDGHPDHGGAWPTDLYYAEFDGTWTDAGTSVSGLSRTENMNAPGDGKFDQHHLPNDVDIQIGRIDLSSLPIFSKTEKELMQQYFAKDHQYRQRLVTVSNRALICETLGLLGGEAPGRTCSMNFNPLFSSAKTESVSGTKYFDTLKKKDYLFSAVTSYAGYNTLLSVGAVDRYKDSIHSVFNTTFGSYHGDWDNSNNMMRGCLGSPGLTLTNVWSGR